MRLRDTAYVPFSFLLFLAIPAYARPTAAEKCEAAKLKAASTATSNVIRAYSQNILTPSNEKLTNALTKATTKLTTAFATAENKGSCETTGDVTAVSDAINTFAYNLRRPTAMAYDGDSITTSLGLAALAGALDVGPETGDLTGIVTITYGFNGSATISGISGGIELRVGATTVRVTDAGIFVNGTPTDAEAIIDGLGVDLELGIPSDQWSPESQAILALASLMTTSSWSVNSTILGGPRAARSAGQPQWWCKGLGLVALGVGTAATYAGCPLAVTAACGPAAPACAATVPVVCAGVGGVATKGAYDAVVSSCTPVCEPNSLLACYPADPTTKNTGICREGIMTCKSDGSGYGPCGGGLIVPLQEVCGNGADDNCNNLPDSSEPACGGDGRRLPDTGQTMVIHHGDDGTYYTGCQPSYTDNGNGTVTDDCTGLIWEQHEASTTLSWPRAIDYCEALTLGGFNDWRLPNIRELLSIVHFQSGFGNFALDSIFLPTGPSYNYWSSTSRVQNTASAWFVDIGGASPLTANVQGKPALYGARCVRGITTVLPQTGSSIDSYPGDDSTYKAGCLISYTDNGDGTLTDNCTGLIWEQGTGGIGSVVWTSALDRCNTLVLGGRVDWRAANARELLTIANYGLAAPAMAAVFYGPSNLTWTATSHPAGSIAAMIVDFSEGNLGTFPKSYATASQCVAGG